ncbi:hypothetical protein [Nitrosococcus oceani]|uniref:Uncharacterized protein n=1 Tax=Nitrosococcus oceani C-27 TaxID=314279 RepID=A0A0E2Z416_9GAMM|nr:hypothetical protein [Nitrosococcus oceani]KFI20209.1 hypothetical protein IB75_04405 [Nitrosococcus oceani C-27]GEM21746.1 hypothetical protein NONS58_31990 [Nitrosococcus oceani]
MIFHSTKDEKLRWETAQRLFKRDCAKFTPRWEQALRYGHTRMSWGKLVDGLDVPWDCIIEVVARGGYRNIEEGALS